MAIRIKTSKAQGDYDQGLSKMLGNPVLPDGMLEELPPTAMFLMQIRLEDIKELDKENILPHQGYLYFFLDTEDGVYSMKPIVKYYDGEPINLIEGFNEVVDECEEYNEDYLIEFEECDDDEQGNKLFGNPADWPYPETDEKLLFQLDPLADGEMNLFSYFDGFMYFFFGEDQNNFDEIRFVGDFS